MNRRDVANPVFARQSGISVVIPALEEQENLIELLPRVVKHLAGLHPVHIFVVVERDCSENNAEALHSLGATVLRRSPSDSFGDAMRTGLAAVPSECEWVLIMDADGSHDPATIPQLYEAALSNEADVVIAPRYVRGGGTANGLFSYLMSRALNKTFSLVLGIKAKDLSTNFKLYRAELVREVALTCHNFDVVEELVARARQRRPELRVVEIPDHFHERVHGESKRRMGPFILSYLVTLVRLRWLTRTRHRRQQ